MKEGRKEGRKEGAELTTRNITRKRSRDEIALVGIRMIAKRFPWLYLLNGNFESLTRQRRCNVISPIFYI